MELIVAFIAVVVIMFVTGVIMIIANSINNKPLKAGLWLVISSIILAVIGFGTCMALVSGI